MYLEISWFIQSQHKYITDEHFIEMKYNRAILLLIPAISAIFLLTDYNISFASGAQSSSQGTIVECNGSDSCYTISCSNDRPCETFSSNQPPFVQPSQEVTTATTQPVEETPIMQSADDGIVIQPIEDSTEQYIEVPVEFCYDGLDNDDDGRVDEECGSPWHIRDSSTLSSED